MKYQKHTLSNNLTILTIPLPSTEAVMMMAMVHFGSRNEDTKHQGIAHFIEHMAFKGGKIYKNTMAISQAIDGAGGEFNAFTSEEVTAYHIKIAREQINVGLDVLADLVIYPKYPSAELAKEKGVIVEEINMYEDVPRYKAGLELAPLIYGDHPLGWSTAGVKQTVLALTPKDFNAYHKANYVGSNITVVLAGKISETDIKEVEKRFGQLPAGKLSSTNPPIESQTEAKLKAIKRKNEQTNLVFGIRALKISDPRRFTYKVLSTILGGNMSSRLFINIRERQGLCYYIYSDTEAFVDTGYFSISAGVDNKRVEIAVKSILKELQKIRDTKVTSDELERAKLYMIGKIKLGLEDSEEVARFFVSQQTLEKSVQTPEEMIEQIQLVKSTDIQKLVQEIFQAKNLNLSVIGPNLDEFRLQKVLNKL